MKLADAYAEAEELRWVNKDAPAEARATLLAALQELTKGELKAGEPFGYVVYFPSEQRQEYCQNLDELIYDMTKGDTPPLTILWYLINAWREAPPPALHICGKINSFVLELTQSAQPVAQPLSMEQIVSACYSYRHDFGLLPQDVRDSLVRTATDWAKAFGIGAKE